MEITRTSMLSGIRRTIDLPVTHEQIDAWRAGKYAQLAFPNLTACQREFVMTGIIEEEWDAEFKEEDAP